MALVRERRQVNLRLPLPETTNRRQSYPLPLPPSTTTTATMTTTTTTTTIFSVTDFTKLSMLGRGNGGTVYKVSHKQTGAIYALKIINSNTLNHLQVHREREILRRTGADSPYVVKCYGVMDLVDGDVGIIMEYMDKGTLECTLKNKGTFNECMISHVATRVLNGLKFLHSKKIVHRDIKPANILVDSSWNVKIADFGVGRIMGRTLDPCNSYVGTCAYMSPERFDPDTYGGNYNGYAADIWSLGLTLMELYLGYFPFLKPGQRPDWATLMCAICFGDPPVLPNGSGSSEFRNFIECCLQKEASKRWSASQLLNHPFLLKSKKIDVKW